MLRLDKIIKPWSEAGSLNANINLYGFWDETTFLTKSGDLGMVLKVAGVDFESLDQAGQEFAVRRLEAALKSFGPGFHIYQYLFKTNRPEIPFARYGEPLIDAAIVVPATEKIMEAATGDKDFWIVDVVGSFCFVHPAKQGINSNLNLITDKGNIYSFTLQDISGQSGEPDLKVIIQPADQSSIAASTGPAQYVPAAQLEQTRSQLATLQTHVTQAVDEYKSAYPMQLRFDYIFKSEEPFAIQSIYHDDKFTYIKTTASEKFSVYELKDGKPDLINYDLHDGTYIIPKIVDKGYIEIGKKHMDFSRKG